jgi:hypothetical protein
LDQASSNELRMKEWMKEDLKIISCGDEAFQFWDLE